MSYVDQEINSLPVRQKEVAVFNAQVKASNNTNLALEVDIFSTLIEGAEGAGSLEGAGSVRGEKVNKERKEG